MNDISHTLGLLRSEVREARAIASNVDHKLARLIEGSATPRRDGSLVVRLAAAQLIGRAERRPASSVAAQMWPGDYELKAAIAPARTDTAGWSAELVAVMIGDISSRLLAPSVFSQLRSLGLQYFYTGSSITKVPSVQPVASGAFIGEGAAIGIGALLITLLSLPPRKAASIVAITRELLTAGPANLETSLEAIMREDLGLAVDAILLDAIAGDAVRPPGLRFGVSALTPTASGTPTEKATADIGALIGAIMPTANPVLITAGRQAVSVAAYMPGLTTIVAPYLASGTLIAVAGDAFASIIGTLDVSSTEEAIIHEENTAPLPLVGGVAQPPVIGSVAAPSRSLFQTASLALRSILDVNWALRRTGAISWMSGVTW